MVVVFVLILLSGFQLIFAATPGPAVTPISCGETKSRTISTSGPSGAVKYDFTTALVASSTTITFRTCGSSDRLNPALYIHMYDGSVWSLYSTYCNAQINPSISCTDCMDNNEVWTTTWPPPPSKGHLRQIELAGTDSTGDYQLQMQCGTFISPTTSPMTSNPTKHPTKHPTTNPTKDPTKDPTNDPTIDPTQDPTANPITFAPTTAIPTVQSITTSSLSTTAISSTSNATTSIPTTDDPTKYPTINPITSAPITAPITTSSVSTTSISSTSNTTTSISTTPISTTDIPTTSISTTSISTTPISLTQKTSNEAVKIQNDASSSNDDMLLIIFITTLSLILFIIFMIIFVIKRRKKKNRKNHQIVIQMKSKQTKSGTLTPQSPATNTVNNTINTTTINNTEGLNAEDMGIKSESDDIDDDDDEMDGMYDNKNRVTAGGPMVRLKSEENDDINDMYNNDNNMVTPQGLDTIVNINDSDTSGDDMYNIEHVTNQTMGE